MMLRRPRLPDEIIALIHHIELNRAGWLDLAKQRAIVALLWMSDVPLSSEEILSEQRAVDLDSLDLAEVRKHLASLEADGIVVLTADGKHKLSEEARRKFDVDIQTANQLDRDVKEQFVALVTANCQNMDAEPLWEDFNDRLLMPTIRSLGARTYEVVTGKTTNIEQIPAVARFLGSYSEDLRPGIRATIVAFMNEAHQDFRRYILKLLNSHFFRLASRLEKGDIDRLASVYQKRRPLFRLLLDTNVVFSILGLHDNPSNQAAISLLRLMDEIKHLVDIRLYVFPPTVDEMKRVMSGCEFFLKEIRFTPNVVEGALRADLTGIVGRYVERAKQSNYQMTPQEYFAPYYNNLAQILREKNIEIFNERLSRYDNDQRVIDDTLSQQSFFTQRHLERKLKGKPKQYEQIWHDMLLWYFVCDKRPAVVGSVATADYWVLTIDFGLLGFDGFKKKQKGLTIPVCLHPTTLIHMLQLFVPWSGQIENAVAGTFRVPFLFHDFDPDSEKATVRILRALSRFENVDDLAPDTVAKVLANDALRMKLEADVEAEEEVVLVREALIEENKRIREELERSEREGRAHEKWLDELKAERQRNQEAIRHLNDRIARETNRRAEAEEKLSAVERSAQSKEEARRNRGRRMVCVLAMIAMGLVIGSIVYGATDWVGTLPGLPNPLFAQVAIALVGLFLWTWLVTTLSPKVLGGVAWRPIALLGRLRSVLAIVMGIAITAVVGDYVVSEWHAWSEWFRTSTVQ